MTVPKVIHVTTTDVSLDLLLLPQLRAFADAGYEVVGASAPGPHVASLERAGIRHRPLHHMTRSMAPVSDAKAAVELYRLFREEAPDVVHLHNPKPGWFGRPAARLARVPAVVNTVHGLYATEDDALPLRAIVYALERGSAAFSDAELVQNPEDVALLRRLRVPQRKLHCLGNGIDLARFDRRLVDERDAAAFRREVGADEDAVLVGAVGRLVWEKGLREIIDAAADITRRAPRVRLVIVGPLDPEKADGLTASDLDQISRDTGIVFAGSRSDVEVVYSALDAYLLASHREGFPRSAMEAAAMGLPVLATDIRGCRQVVDHGTTGLLFEVRDPQSLADAVVAIAGDEDLRMRMASAALAKAHDEFDQERQIEMTLAVYGRLVAGR